MRRTMDVHFLERGTASDPGQDEPPAVVAAEHMLASSSSFPQTSGNKP